jgi:hypothetical protein
MPLCPLTFFWYAIKRKFLVLMACQKKVFGYSGMAIKIDPMSCGMPLNPDFEKKTAVP